MHLYTGSPRISHGHDAVRLTDSCVVKLRGKALLGRLVIASKSDPLQMSRAATAKCNQRQKHHTAETTY